MNVQRPPAHSYLSYLLPLSHFIVKGLYEVTFTLRFVTQVVQTNTNFDICRGVMACGCMAILLKRVEAN